MTMVGLKVRQVKVSKLFLETESFRMGLMGGTSVRSVRTSAHTKTLRSVQGAGICVTE